MPRLKIEDIVAKYNCGSEIEQLAKSGYDLAKIREYLLAQNISLSTSQIKTYLERKNILFQGKNTKQDNRDRQFINDYVEKFPIINPIELMGKLEIPIHLDTDEKLIDAIQKCHIELMFKVWAIYYTYLDLYMNNKIDTFPFEIGKMYMGMFELGSKILGVQMNIDDFSAIARVKRLGLKIVEDCSDTDSQ